MLHLLDYFLTIFHAAVILFVMLGWYSPGTRKIHITVILLILVSWLLLGFYKGTLGYCPLTAWHWDVKRALGETDMPSSFLEYLIEGLVGINFTKKIIDGLAVIGLVFGVTMAMVVKFKRPEDLKKKSYTA